MLQARADAILPDEQLDDTALARDPETDGSEVGLTQFQLYRSDGAGWALAIQAASRSSGSSFSASVKGSIAPMPRDSTRLP